MPPGKTPHEHGFRSRRLRVIAGAIAAVLFLAVAILHSPPVRIRVLRALTSRIADAGYVARADAIDYNLLKLSVRVSNLSIAVPSAQTTPFFKARELSASVPWSVFKGQFGLDRIEIVSPTVTLHRDAQGHDNWTANRPDTGPSTLTALHIGRLVMSNLAVDWTDDQQSMHADAALSLDLVTNGGSTSGPIAMARPANFRWRDRATSISVTGGRVSWNDRDLALEALSLRAAEGTLRIDGRVSDLLREPHVDARVDAGVNLEAASPWMGLERRLTGTAQAAARVTSDAVDLTSLRTEIAGGEVNGRARASFSGAGSAHLTWERLDLADLLRSVLANPPRVLPAARAAGALDAQWTTTTTFDGLQLTASSRLLGDRAQRGRTDLPVAATAALEVNGRKWKLSADRVEALGASGSANLSGSLDTANLQRSTVAGTLHARTSDDRAWARALVDAGWLREVPPVRGTAAADFAVGGTFGAPSLNGALDATVQYESLAPARILAHASVAPDAIGLTDIDARLPAGTARGSVRWSPASDALAGQIDGSLPLKDLPALSTSIPRSLGLGGSVDVSATLAGTMARPRIAAHASGDALEVSGQTIDRLSGDLHVAGADLFLDRLVLEQSTGRIEASGSFNTGRNSYTGRVTATDVSLHPVLEINGQRDASLSALLDATFEGNGTLADPTGRGHLSLAATRWGSADIGEIDADVTLANRSAAFTLDARDVALKAQGAVGLDPAGPVSAVAFWEPADVAAIARRFALTVPVSGPAALAAEWNATRDRLADGSGWLTLDRADLLVASQAFRLSERGRIEADRGVIRVTPIVLQTGSSSLTIDGALRSGRTGGRLAVTLDGSLTDFGFVRDLVQPRTEGAPERPPIAGAVHALISAEDTGDAPRISGTFTLGGGRVPVTDTHAVTGVEIAARFDQGVFFLDRATAAFEGASLSATARVPSNVFLEQLPAALRQYVPAVAGPATLSAQVGSITTSVAAPFVDPSTLAQIALQAEASVDLQADGPTVDRVHGSATLNRVELTLAGVSFDQAVPTRLTVQDGRVTVDAFRWGRESNQVVLEGGVMLGDRASIDLLAKAALDLRLLNAFVPGVRTTGRGDAEIRVGGTLETPTVDGHVTLTGGEVRIADPRMIVGDVNGTITLARDRINVERVSATINGGEAELTGSIRHEKFEPVDGSVTLTAKGAAFDLSGLRAETDATLTWTLDPTGSTVQGTVTLLRSAFRERLSLTSQLLAALRKPAAPARTEATSLVDRTRLDVRVVTDEDLVIDNNLAQLTLSGDLRAVGTVSRPSVTGRATLGEGGALFFNGTRYRLQDQGSIDFANPDHIEPDLNLKAVTRVQGNEITLTLRGTPATLESTLESDNPTLSQSDLVSLLLIGRTAGTNEEDLAAGGDQLVGLLAGGFLETAGRAVGFDTARVERGEPDVRLDAGLVASETDPGARFTVGKNIGTHFELVFSQSLQQSGGLTWIIGYKPRSGIDLRYVSLDDGDRLYTFSHDITFANPARRTAATVKPVVRVSDVVITGAGADEPKLRSHLKVKPGDTFSFFQWQDDRGRVEDFYTEQRRLEAHVVTRRLPEPSDASRVQLTYDVTPGPRTTVVVDGFTLSKSSLAAIDRAWERSVADDFLTEEVTQIARADLAESGFVLPSVTARVQDVGGSRELRVTIAPGQRADERRVEFSGNAAESSEKLRLWIADRGLTQAVWTQPDDVRDALVAFYRTNGYLNAAVRMDPVQINGKTAIQPIHIDEGGAFRVAAVQVEGAHAIPADEMSRLIGFSAGDQYGEDRLDQAQRALDAAYRARGYNRVGIDCQARRPAAGAGDLAVDILVRVDEGPQQRLRDVVTTGLARTNPDVVSRALKLDLGTPVNLAAWNAARKRVYETGAFRSVDIEREVIEPAGSAPAASEEPVRAKVAVQEWPPLRVRYGIEVRDELNAAGDAARSNTPDTELPGGRTLGIGLAGDLSARGLFGRGISAGVAGRYSGDERASRAYGTSPSFFGRPITSTAFVERSLEQSGTDLVTEEPVFQTLKTTFTFEQRVRPRKGTTISYLYTYERNHTVELNPNPLEPLPFDVRVTIGRFSSALLMDRRNDPLNATLGWFHSSSMTVASGALGSDLRFVKYFVQQNYYRPVGPVVVAVAGRLGLATAFESTLTPDERFFAGGGNSVRGYAQDILSPRDFTGGAVGGNALVVINQEVRFPIFKIVRGVGFFDAGRAFEHASDLRIRDLATSAGFGLRLLTPFVLLRVDFGVPFETVGGVRRPRWFFSIGQLF